MNFTLTIIFILASGGEDAVTPADIVLRYFYVLMTQPRFFDGGLIGEEEEQLSNGAFAELANSNLVEYGGGMAYGSKVGR